MTDDDKIEELQDSVVKLQDQLEAAGEAKGWAKSKTMWFSIAIASAGGLNAVLDERLVSDPKTMSVLAVVVGVLSVVLRAITKGPVKS